MVERDFSSLALLAPGVTTGTGGYGAGGTGESLSFNGQRAFTNGVFIDGASAMWQFYGKQASTFPQDWVQEFQVLTNSFGAEFGTASGGIMNVISRSGSNQFTGRAYGFFRDSSLDSPPYAGRFVNGEPHVPRRTGAAQPAALGLVLRRPHRQGPAVLLRAATRTSTARAPRCSASPSTGGSRASRR